MDTGRQPLSNRALLFYRMSVGVLLLALWEVAGMGHGEKWISRPSLMALKLASWLQGDLHIHLATTLTEVLAGMAIGGACGSILGLSLGRTRVLSVILRPIIVGLYSVPLITLAPVIILIFGLEMSPKIILVSLVVFFLLFFNTFSGAQALDNDILDSLKLMGASRIELFRKMIAPAAMVWILAGFKIALPYALVAAVTGEMLSSRSGIGLLLVRGYAQFDMTAVYAALLILMGLGAGLSEGLNRIELWFLRWRVAAR